MANNVIPIDKNKHKFTPTDETQMMLQIIESSIKKWALTQRSVEDVFFVESYLGEVLGDIYMGL